MISVTILTKNSERYLKDVLESVKNFDEVVIYDTGSTDGTFKILKQYSNVSLHQGSLKGFGPTHNVATSLAKNDWILSIDSDEIVTPDMADEILQTKLNDGCVYSFPRHNFYNGKFIKWCGWYPDRQIRLYNRKKTKFSDVHVHESIISDGLRSVSLKSPIHHYSYDSVSEFLQKMQVYSDLFAKQYQGKKSSSTYKAIAHGLYTFFKCYFLKRGFLGGYEGFAISVYNGNTAFYKYLKLKEINENSSVPG